MPPKILIVEDSVTQAERLRIVLVSNGFEPTVSHHVEDALDQIVAQRFDAIISDIVMPGLSGYDLCHRVKSSRLSRDIPVILLTTLNDPTDVIQGLECGADNFLTKPYEPQNLIERLRAVLENRRLRSQGKLNVGVEILFLGKKFVISSEKEQILDLLISTFEDTVRTNRALRGSQAELAAAKSKLEHYAVQLEGKVQFSEEKYAKLVQNASVAILILDESGSILEINRTGEELLGKSKTELAGDALAIFVDTPKREAFDTEFLRLLREGSGRMTEVPICGANAKPAVADWSAATVEFQQERVVLGILRDITKEVELKNQLLHAQKMEAVGRLAGGVAHDFNNLLTVISGYTQLVMEMGGSTEQQEHLDEVFKASQRASALTQQLLAFSRRQVLQPQVVDLNGVIRNLERMLRRLIGEDIVLGSVLADQLGPVRADPGQLEQVIVNIVVNARDAMPNGGRITVETSNEELDELYIQGRADLKPGEYTMLAITDTGQGMSAETKSRLFEPFFTTKGQGKGTGLGLSTVYGIVRQTGGDVWVYSEPWRGTTFKIYLPRASAAVASKAALTGDRPAPTGSGIVLVVEDEESVRRLASLVLRQNGYTVLTASSGEEALEICDRQGGRIDLLISDIVMPGMDAFDLRARIRAQHPHIRMLFTSGYTEHAVLGANPVETADAFISKPFTGQQLTSKVHELLGEISAKGQA
jgi:PAS domain S-box-containing protein